jgi:hypothetical protein
VCGGQTDFRISPSGTAPGAAPRKLSHPEALTTTVTGTVPARFKLSPRNAFIQFQVYRSHSLFCHSFAAQMKAKQPEKLRQDRVCQFWSIDTYVQTICSGVHTACDRSGDILCFSVDWVWATISAAVESHLLLFVSFDQAWNNTLSNRTRLLQGQYQECSSGLQQGPVAAGLPLLQPWQREVRRIRSPYLGQRSGGIRSRSGFMGSSSEVPPWMWILHLRYSERLTEHRCSIYSLISSKWICDK